MAASAGPSAWDLYCMKAEVNPVISADLLAAVTGTTVVLLLDDSGSMQNAVRPPGSNPMAPTTTTRWSELAGDTQNIIELVTAAAPQQGVDIHFMNRPGLPGVRDPSQLQPLFNAPPSGGTPMIGLLQRVYSQYSRVQGRVLLILITDGEPSDGEYNDLFRTLNQKPDNFYISMVECNDNEEEMDYLTGWDTQIPRFHNQEDYGEELNLVRRVNGPSTKFTRANYIQMTVMSPIFPKYAIDIRRAGGRGVAFGAVGIGSAGWGQGSYQSYQPGFQGGYQQTYQSDFQNPFQGGYQSGPQGW